MAENKSVSSLLKTICVVPQVSGTGGMVSFERRFVGTLAERGIHVNHNPASVDNQAILVIGGTKNLAGLWRAHRRGIPIVQRLNGMNWLHRRVKTGLRHWMRAEYGNFILNTIRTRFADRIIYQSQFARDWWEQVYGPAPVPNEVIYNGVDLETFTPAGEHERPPNCVRLLIVEGNLGGGYEMGLDNAIRLTEQLRQDYIQEAELMVVGRTSAHQREHWETMSPVTIHWTGEIPPDRIPFIDRSAHLLFSADLNAACPNSVVEALACGLPVISFDTGALPEMVPPEAGRVVSYGGDPWKLDNPDLPALAKAAGEVIAGEDKFRLGARAQAKEKFNLIEMADRYLNSLATALSGF